MKKRMVLPLAILVVAGAFLLVQTAKLSIGTELAEAAQDQTRLVLTADRTRGTIYDCNLVPLTNVYEQSKAIVVGTPEAVTAIGTQFPAEESAQIFARLQQGKPVLISWREEYAAANGIHRFSVPIRYTAPAIAAHVIGYIDSGGVGVCGIEAAYEAYLQVCGGQIRVQYTADALGRTLSGEPIVVTNVGGNPENGVILTLDSRIQRIAERAVEELDAGAVVVMEVESGKIRAMVSTPTYDPARVEDALNAARSPLVNRALCAYNVGSVFKLAVACAAQKAEIDLGEMECTGTMEYAGRTFQCIGGNAHGLVDLERAIAVSCNCYFIRLAEQVGAERILQMAELLGFGEESVLAEGMVAGSGVVPAAEDLSAPAALANVSFGQGDLLATPVQIASMVQAIANGGIRVEPQLVEGIYSVESGMEPVETVQNSRMVFRTKVAEAVQNAMIAAVESGTVQRGKPESGGAGAKTATAETGWSVGGETMIHAWCAGFYPAEKPEYAIVVFAENGKSGSGVCAPVFKEIADGIARVHSN